MKKVLVLFLSFLLVFMLASCSLVSKGDSAYDIAVKNGFVGTEQEWLASLKGQDGTSLNINDIYEEYTKNHPEASFDDFLRDIFQNTQYITGESAYQIALKHGFEGTEEEWLESLRGERGLNGEPGTNVDLYQVYTKLVELGQYNKTYYDFVLENVGGTTDQFALVAQETMLNSVMVVASNEDIMNDELSDEDFQSAIGYGGAGIIYNLDKENGSMYVITNFHVCYDDKNDDILDHYWVFSYGRVTSDYAIAASFVGGTATYDIAVLKIEDNEYVKNSQLKETKIKDSNAIHAGETCFAIGAPVSNMSVTKGIISVDSENVMFSSISPRATEQSTRVIRIDCPVNHGNSGGGLYDENGYLIGLVKAKRVADQAESIGYAIPSNVVMNITKNIIINCNGVDKLYPQRCLMNIKIGPYNTQVVYENGYLVVSDDVTVVEVVKDGIAEGILMVDDIIKEMTFQGNTYQVTRVHQIVDLCLLAVPGDVINLKVLRDGTLLDVSITYASAVTVY